MPTDMGTIWDELVNRSLAGSEQEKPTTTCSTKKLKLLETPIPVQDDTPRTISGINPATRSVIRGLVAGEKPWPFVLSGKTGRGKSAAALCLADHVEGALYLSFPRFLKMADWSRGPGGVSVVRQMRDPNFDDGRTKTESRDLSEFEFFRFLSNVPLLVLDDVGTRSGYSDAQYDSLYLVLSDRAFKPTVVVSNLTLDGIKDAFDERIASRLSRGTLHVMTGEDRRREVRPK